MTDTANFTDLILLMGTNPVPNYAVAHYFVKTNNNLKRLWLLHSDKTRGFADRLIELISKNFAGFSTEKINKKLINDISKESSVCQTMDEMIREIVQDQTARVHLNYTGGTKVMGVHTYRKLEQEKENRLQDTEYSYLDAREFCIWCTRGNETTRLHDGDLRTIVQISFSDLITLHGFKTTGNEQGKKWADITDFQPVLEKYQEMIKKAEQSPSDEYYLLNECYPKKDTNPCNVEFFEYYEKGVYLRRLFQKDRRYCINFENSQLLKGIEKQDITWLNQVVSEIDKFNKQIPAYKPKGKFLSLIRSLPEEYRIVDEQGNPCSVNRKLEKKAIEFIDGKWLEYFVCWKLHKHHPEISWKLQKDKWEFELDLVFMNGYQLVGISCTMDFRKSVCKNKGFEIVRRTQQIGGSEAKAVLVTCMDNNGENFKKLKQELQLDTGGENNILVLGIRDLSNIEEKICDFINKRSE